MILIVTNAEGDYSHPPLIDWLNKLGGNYKIINGSSLFNSAVDFHYTNDKEELIYDGIYLKKEVTIVYARRWMYGTPPLSPAFEDKVLNKKLIDSLKLEVSNIRDFLFYHLSDVKWIPSIKLDNVNKLQILELASQAGLRVPKTLVTNKKEDLEAFFHQNNEKIITKAINDFTRIDNDEFIINPVYTKKVDESIINSLPNRFFVSCFQEMIPKKLEYRVFYFEGAFFTTAILSQENHETHFDSRNFRSHDVNNPRLMKASLPKEVASKIDNFMKLANLNIGSIDLIHTPEDEYVFLEINPVGQISGYSAACNHLIEKHIAAYLIKYDLEKNEQKRNRNTSNT